MATGANEFVPRIPGVDGANVVSVIDAHMNWDLVKGERIVVCGGGLSGCEAAYDLAKEKGMSVTVVEMGDKVLNGVFTINADSLLRKMQGYDITLRTSARVTRVTEEGVYIEHDGQEEFLPCDTVVAAFGLTPEREGGGGRPRQVPQKDLDNRGQRGNRQHRQGRPRRLLRGHEPHRLKRKEESKCLISLEGTRLSPEPLPDWAAR